MDSMVDMSMSRYDTNKDDKIDKDEIAAMDERARGRIEASDSNGDGEITKEELKKGIEAMMKQMQSGGGGGMRGGGGTP